jgi:hypothetical protein
MPEFDTQILRHRSQPVAKKPRPGVLRNNPGTGVAKVGGRDSVHVQYASQSADIKASVVGNHGVALEVASDRRPELVEFRLVLDVPLANPVNIDIKAVKVEFRGPNEPGCFFYQPAIPNNGNS